MEKECKGLLERFSWQLRNFLIFLYERFGRGYFTYAEVKKEVAKIPFNERKDRFGCFDERRMTDLYKRYKVVDRNPSESNNIWERYKYTLKEEISDDIENLISVIAKNNKGFVW